MLFSLMDVTETNVTFNASSSGSIGTTPLHVFLYVCAAGVVLLTVCGNLLVIISISHFKQLHTPTNFFILSLAMADLLVAATVMPFAFSVLIETHWMFSETLCVTFNMTGYFLTCVSIYNVAFIAVDRFLALRDPFFYSTKITVNLAWCSVIVIWLLSLLYNVIIISLNKNLINITVPVIRNKSQEYLNLLGECYFTFSDITWATIDFVLVFLVPCSTIIFLYLGVFKIVSSQANAIRCAIKQGYSANFRKIKLSMVSEKKAAKILGLVVVVFLLCLVPSCICALIDPSTLSPFQYALLIKIAYWIVLSNSLINPMIYAFFYPWFQKCAKNIITCRICAVDSSLKSVFTENV